MTADNARTPDQRSLYEQVSDLWRLARAEKMYDAQDWLATHWTGRPLPSRPLPAEFRPEFSDD